MKPPSKLVVTSKPENVFVGKNTTVQDFLDWINFFQAENYVLKMENEYMRLRLAPRPDNVVELAPPKPKRTRRKAKVTNDEGMAI